ncbi:MAG: hypothetical protein ABW185_16670 [Sedimenticola sp.]
MLGEKVIEGIGQSYDTDSEMDIPLAIIRQQMLRSRTSTNINQHENENEMQQVTETNDNLHANIFSYNMSDADITTNDFSVAMEAFLSNVDIEEATLTVESIAMEEVCETNTSESSHPNSKQIVCDRSNETESRAINVGQNVTQLGPDSGDNDTDVPLAMLKSKLMLSNKMVISADEHSESDSDYAPSLYSNDSCSPSSDYTDEESLVNKSSELCTGRKRRKLRNVRNKNWKRRGKRIKRKSSNACLDSHSSQQAHNTSHGEVKDSDESTITQVLEQVNNKDTHSDGEQVNNKDTHSDAEQVNNKDTHSDSKLKCPTLDIGDENVSKANDLNTLDKAIKQSIKEQHVLDVLQKYHANKLDKILASNMVTRHPVYPDGNCLFAAVLEHVDESMSVTDLRSKIAKHFEENIIHYICFVTFPDIITADEEHTQFIDMIEEIKQDGKWNSDMSDIVPLCIANVLQRPLRIYSSRPFNPVCDITPDLVTIANTAEPIPLAHTAIRGSDHYDAVKKKTVHDKSHTDRTCTSTATCHENTNGNKTAPVTADSGTTVFSPPSTSCHAEAPSAALQTGLHTPSKGQRVTNTTINITPHKDANYKSPKKKKLTRKKINSPETWKRNVCKKDRSRGNAYTNKHGQHIAARTVKGKDCTRCRFKCSDNVTEDQRADIFKTYWDLGDYEKQRGFICQHIDQTEPETLKRHRDKPRTTSRTYFLTVGDIRHRVCKEFFLKTLDVGKKTVEYALKCKVHGVFVGKDARGSSTPINKTSEEDTKIINDHIKSFATVDPHYTRKDTKRQYLARELNIRKMYSLYVDKCKESGGKPVHEKVYRSTFCREHNLSFYHPKKDQCQVCNHYDDMKSAGTVTPLVEQRYVDHQARKKRARLEKENDKKRAKVHPEFHVSAFDLEAVLTTPCSLVGELYYKRKLCCYNLSFYTLASGNVTCYLWDETQGSRGSCEVATCLMLHLNAITTKTSAVKEVTYYSDTCGGQNRNQFVAAALLYSIQSMDKIECINHKFLESGHSEMECDSVHAAIEHTKSLTKVHVPSQWETVVTLARKSNPYVVVPMKYTDFMDFKQMKKDSIKNVKIEKNGNKVNWLKIKWIRVQKKMPNTLCINYTFDEENFLEINAFSNKTRGRPKTPSMYLQPRYESKTPISAAKKADLLSLCASGTIPAEYHQYYRSLPSKKTVRDKLPAPAASEEEQDTDDN